MKPSCLSQLEKIYFYSINSKQFSCEDRKIFRHTPKVKWKPTLPSKHFVSVSFFDKLKNTIKAPFLHVHADTKRLCTKLDGSSSRQIVMWSQACSHVFIFTKSNFRFKLWRFIAKWRAVLSTCESLNWSSDISRHQWLSLN